MIDGPTPIVRRCPRCAAPAAVALPEEIDALGHSFDAGASPAVAWRCQACGYTEIFAPLSPSSHAVAPLAVLFLLPPGVLLLAQSAGSGDWRVLGLGLLFVGTAGWAVATVRAPHLQQRRMPIVPDAAAPAIRFSEIVPRRRCTCGGEARPARTRVHRWVGLYAGSATTYQCLGCGRQLDVPDPTRLGWWAIHSAIPFAAIGGLRLASGTALAILVAAALGWLTARGVWVRWRYPVVGG